MDTNSILEELKRERDRISGAIAALEGFASGNGRWRHRSGPKPKAVKAEAIGFPFGAARPKRRRRKLSAAAKRRISESAKARWARAKRAGKNSL